MSEDIHDLFGRDDDDEEASGAEEPDDESVEASDGPGDGSAGSTAAGFPSLGGDDGESTDGRTPSGGESVESTGTAADDEEDAGASSMDWSSSADKESADDGGFEPAGSTTDDTASGDDDGAGDDAFGLTESTCDSSPSPGEAPPEESASGALETETTDADSDGDAAGGLLGGAGGEESTTDGPTGHAEDDSAETTGGTVAPGEGDRGATGPDGTTAETPGVGRPDVGEDSGEGTPTDPEGTASTGATREPPGRAPDEVDSAGATTDAETTDDDGGTAIGRAEDAPDGQDGGIEVEPADPGSDERSTAAAGDTDHFGSAGTGPSGDASEPASGGSRPDSATASTEGASAADASTGDSGTLGKTSSGGGVEKRGDAGARSATTTTDGPAVDDGVSGTVSGSAGSAASDESGSDDDERPTMPASGSNRLSTGIDALDEVMGGGVPPGRMIVLVADPGVQSELIVDSVLAQRDTLYVTTDRPDWEVQKDIEPGLGSGEIEIRDHTPDSLLLGVDTLLDEIGTSTNFVLDSVNELELVPRQRYRIFLSDVKRRLFDTGSVGLLTGVTVDHESARDLTLRRADIVWRLETRTTGKEIVNLLSIPKFRGGAAVTETVKLELTDEVRVDPSWNGE